ncbi:hypothetical protein RvY_09411 [Ramazzottius varieornatus]|uniref:C2 domain-containing protein n=1 Tax=Ramazzottius varieornatus TaxID=947166 RepID=A0A1D1V9A0_RAMVA|nr:hypothetical protein RvY_09411 [Ramazzottius varieornatus]
MSHWVPTHVQVTVVRAKNLIPKSKNGETNNAYVTIQLGKEKFETSVLEKSKAPEWNEECDLRITDLTGTIVLTAYHKHSLGTDDFLGRAELHLQDLNFYDRPKNIWFPLRSKKKDVNKEEKYRGEIQVRLNFYVQNLAVSVPNGLDVKKERSSSFRNTLSNLGKTLPNRKHHGSVMDLGSHKSSGFGSGMFSSLSRSQLRINEQSNENVFVYKQDNVQAKAVPPTPELSKQKSFASASDKISDDMVSMTSSVDVKDTIPSIQRIESESSTTLSIAPVKKSSSFNKTKSFVSSVVSQVTGNGSLHRSPSEVDLKNDTPILRSDNTVGRSARTAERNSMTVETKRTSTLSESDRSPRLNGSGGFGNGDSSLISMHAPRFTDAEPNTPEMIHVPKDLIRKYGHLEKGDLIAKLADAEKKLSDKQTEIDRMQAYIESLLLKVMEADPKILQSYPPNGLKNGHK